MSFLEAIPVVGKLLDKVITDKDARAAADENLEALKANGELQSILGQIQINLVEAAHKSLFVAGWRPFIGWTCGVGLLYHFILQPFLGFLIVVASLIWDFEVPALPDLEVEQLMTLVLGMLGLGGMRSYEKKNGVSRET